MNLLFVYEIKTDIQQNLKTTKLPTLKAFASGAYLCTAYVQFIFTMIFHRIIVQKMN